MTEAQLQAKIIKGLEKRDWFVIKIVRANKGGVPDLFAAAPNGRVMFVEVKNPETGGVVSKLQEYQINEIKKRKICAFVSNSYDDVMAMADSLCPTLLQ